MDPSHPRAAYAGLEAIPDGFDRRGVAVDRSFSADARFDRMVELNVIEQVQNLAKTAIIQRAWAHRAGPHLHGWAYRLSDGIVKPLIEMAAGAEMDPIDQYSNLV